MAGSRLGYLVGPTWLVDELDKVVLPYHLDAAKQIAGRLALTFVDEMETRVQLIVSERERIAAALPAMPIDVFPSGANFILFRPRRHGGRRRVAGAARPQRARPRLLGLAAPRRLPARHHRHAGGERRVPHRPLGGPAMSRSASRVRATTKETSIELSIDLDGTGPRRVSTGIPFYDHMLDQLGRHGGFDLRIAATGDLHIDTHHTVEDVGIALGEAFREALGDKVGVRRFASGLYPLDEALVEVALDLSGRPFVVWDVPMPECLPLGNPPFDPQLAEHAVHSFATAAGITLHVAPVPRHATCTTSSRPRSRAWPAACATPCASRARRCRRTKGVL